MSKRTKKVSNDTIALTNAEKKDIVEENIKRLTHQKKKGNFTHKEGEEHYEACGILVPTLQIFLMDIT